MSFLDMKYGVQNGAPELNLASSHTTSTLAPIAVTIYLIDTGQCPPRWPRQETAAAPPCALRPSDSWNITKHAPEVRRAKPRLRLPSYYISLAHPRFLLLSALSPG